MKSILGSLRANTAPCTNIFKNCQVHQFQTSADTPRNGLAGHHFQNCPSSVNIPHPLKERWRILKLDVGMIFVPQELWSYKNILVYVHKHSTLIITVFVSKNIFLPQKGKEILNTSAYSIFLLWDLLFIRYLAEWKTGSYCAAHIKK